MKKSLNFESLSVGLAMFSMFFGAGNVIFPLAIGQFAGDKNLFAILGLLLTAVIMPITGVIAMILYDGNYRAFFGRLGYLPGLTLATFIIALLGPLGSTPRCIALSYTTFKSSFLDLSPIAFSGLSCILIYLFTVKKNQLLNLLGWVLTPLLLVTLTLIILFGLWFAPAAPQIDASGLSLFFHGLKEGYNTMDLLAAFFFSSTILNILRKKGEGKNYLKTTIQASFVGALLLALTYVGFSFLASYHGFSLNVEKDELLAAITLKIAGPYAGLLVCLTVSLACLTTAIALISSFTDFMHTEIIKERVSYHQILIGSLVVTFLVATLGFSGISAFLGPVLEICYPALIVLTIVNIFNHLKLKALLAVK